MVSNKGVVYLESTLFQKEYFDKLLSSHLVLFRKFKNFEKHDKVISLENFLDRNYYHWLLESIPRLMRLDSVVLKEYKIVLDKNPPQFVIDSLKFFFNIERKDIIIRTRDRIKASECLIVSFPHQRNSQSQWTDFHDPSAILNISNYVQQKFSNKIGKNFIISRNNTQQRRILNQDILVDKFVNFNFEIVELEKLSFYDQVSLFNNANIVIATHGAGLTNILFSKYCTIIELFPNERNERDAFCYFEISFPIKLNHYLIEYTSVNAHQDLRLSKENIKSISEILHKK